VGFVLIVGIVTGFPFSLIGLPLIALCELLERAGLQVV
jgi:predicted house-cleaning NTP pyrophosphatase (Maf/HAM1 superfamily)